ncbi:MAG: hypothetical protein IPJ41_04675 [Phycisphaerales bacterium]|nr:hypothetical protein [Phycisphaerales bacterium]
MNDRVDRQIALLRALRWTGPDRNARVEQFLKERLNMKEHKKPRSRMTIGVLLGVMLAGGALAGAATYRLVTGSFIWQDEGGSSWEVELPSNIQAGPDGTFIADDGTVYSGVEVVIDPPAKE